MIAYRSIPVLLFCLLSQSLQVTLPALVPFALDGIELVCTDFTIAESLYSFLDDFVAKIPSLVIYGL